MNRTFRRAALVLILCLTIIFGGVMLSSCTDGGKSGKKSVVCSIFPFYDWTLAVMGDRADQFEVKLLCDNGADLHSYQATIADIAAISSADLFIYVGGESDAWAEAVVEEARNKDIIALPALKTVDAKLEETSEGMEAEDVSEEYDEHVWLSLRNAKLLVASIAEALARLDADYAAFYEDNAAAYTGSLTALDEEYTELADSCLRKTVLFGDRFPFRYLTDDYGLSYFAAFPGCSAETEASFKTVATLAGKIDSLSLPVILVIENSNKSVAESIRAQTSAKNQAILVLDSCQSVTKEQIAEGKTYLSVMTANLAVLRTALN